MVLFICVLTSSAITDENLAKKHTTGPGWLHHILAPGHISELRWSHIISLVNNVNSNLYLASHKFLHQKNIFTPFWGRLDLVRESGLGYLALFFVSFPTVFSPRAPTNTLLTSESANMKSPHVRHGRKILLQFG